MGLLLYGNSPKNIPSEMTVGTAFVLGFSSRRSCQSNGLTDVVFCEAALSPGQRLLRNLHLIRLAVIPRLR